MHEVSAGAKHAYCGAPAAVISPATASNVEVLGTGTAAQLASGPSAHTAVGRHATPAGLQCTSTSNCKMRPCFDHYRNSADLCKQTIAPFMSGLFDAEWLAHSRQVKL